MCLKNNSNSISSFTHLLPSFFLPPSILPVSIPACHFPSCHSSFLFSNISQLNILEYLRQTQTLRDCSVSNTRNLLGGTELSIQHYYILCHRDVREAVGAIYASAGENDRSCEGKREEREGLVSLEELH